LQTNVPSFGFDIALFPEQSSARMKCLTETAPDQKITGVDICEGKRRERNRCL